MGVKDSRVRFAPQAAEFIPKVHPENRKMIRQAIDKIRRNPYSGYDLQEELLGFKSFKSKKYRILYKINEPIHSIDVYLVGHRRDVYQQFRTLLKNLTS